MKELDDARTVVPNHIVQYVYWLTCLAVLRLLAGAKIADRSFVWRGRGQSVCARTNGKDERQGTHHREEVLCIIWRCLGRRF